MRKTLFNYLSFLDILRLVRGILRCLDISGSCRRAARGQCRGWGSAFTILLTVFFLLSNQYVFAFNEASTGAPPLRLIVKYKHDAFSVFSIQQRLFLHQPYVVQSIQPMAGHAYIVSLDRSKIEHSSILTPEDIDQVLEKLRQDPELMYAVEDRVGYFNPSSELKQVDSATLIYDFDVLSHDLQWDEFAPPGGIMLESAPGLTDGAWAYTHGETWSPVVVAVLDTGIALNDSLVNNLVKDEWGQIWGWNFAANNRNTADETPSFHGTHVAGTIAAYGHVVKGVGDQLNILPIKIPDSTGMFYESQVINAMYWAVGGEIPGVPHNTYSASVLNLSFGVDERPGKTIDHCDEAIQEAIYFVKRRGAVIMAAAGNDNIWEHYNAPAVCNGVMKIAATGPEGLRAYYTNYGPSIAFAAPGGDLRYGKQGGVLSTVNPGGGYQNTGFDYYQGTSMASPHAAGVAALLYAVTNHSITPERVEQILYFSTHAFGMSEDKNRSCIGEKPCGHGILDAYQAVKAAMANYDVLFSPSTSDLNKAHHSPFAFVLQQNKYPVCEIIGFDGVGCFNP